MAAERALATIEHGFTHFDLDLEPRWLRLAAAPRVVQDRDDFLWHRPSDAPAVGVPAPVAALFGTLAIDACDERGARNDRAAQNDRAGARRSFSDG